MPPLKPGDKLSFCMANSEVQYDWVIDAGNTSIKSALFSQQECIEIKHWDYESFASQWKEYVSKWNPSRIVYSSVSNHLPQSFCEQAIAFQVNQLKGWDIEYHQPDTLGVDRVAAVLGARQFFPDQFKILVVDLGTCVTYTYCHGSAIRGLSIVPGLQMRWNAMHHFTSKLPLVNSETPTDEWGTMQNLVEGGKRGWQMEQHAWIGYFCQFHDIHCVLLTGSDVVHLEIKEEKNCKIIPYLNLYGLKAWLDV